MRKSLRNGFFAILLTALSLPLWAQEESVSSSRELTLVGSTLPEAKLSFAWRWTIPILRGESPLTGGNNIGLGLSAEISPISLNGIAEAVWTPVAFFQLGAGGRLASGWSMSLFGADSYGIGLNRDDGTGKAEHSGGAFEGIIWKGHMSGALQFDLAALVPGDWHHVVLRSGHEINHKGYTAAGADQSWYFENDDGENVNGWNYYGNLLIGYQMPIILNTVALLAEADLYLYSMPGRERWGDEKIRWIFSALTNWTLTKQLGAALIVQFRTRRNYDDSKLYYRNRTIDASNPLRLEFYRVAAALTYKF